MCQFYNKYWKISNNWVRRKNEEEYKLKMVFISNVFLFSAITCNLILMLHTKEGKIGNSKRHKRHDVTCVATIQAKLTLFASQLKRHFRLEVTVLTSVTNVTCVTTLQASHTLFASPRMKNWCKNQVKLHSSWFQNNKRLPLPFLPNFRGQKN